MAEECPGINSKMMGKAKACEGCPNQKICSSSKPDPDIDHIKERLRKIKYILPVMCGKGGVGKSFLTVLLAKYFSKNFKTIVLDMDLSGPTISNLTVDQKTIIDIDEHFDPIATNGFDVVSVGDFKGFDDAIFTSQTKNYLLKKVFINCRGLEEYDVMVIDTPPNVTDEHLALFSYFKNLNAVLISTADFLSVADLQRQTTFCGKAKINILGVVENMKSFRCHKCDKINTFNDEKHIFNFCIERNIKYIGSLNYDKEVARNLDSGVVILKYSMEEVCRYIFNSLK